MHDQDFLKHMGDAISKSDGEISFDSMIERCRETMAMKAVSRNRGPTMSGILRLDLILPRARGLKKKTSKESQSNGLVRKGIHSSGVVLMLCLNIFATPSFPF